MIRREKRGGGERGRDTVLTGPKRRGKIIPKAGGKSPLAAPVFGRPGRPSPNKVTTAKAWRLRKVSGSSPRIGKHEKRIGVCDNSRMTSMLNRVCEVEGPKRVPDDRVLFSVTSWLECWTRLVHEDAHPRTNHLFSDLR